jgi:Xaa-Pro aminopeptidase
MGLSIKHLTKEQKELYYIIDKMQEKAINSIKSIKNVNVEKLKRIKGLA